MLDLLIDENDGEIQAPALLTKKNRLSRLLQAAWFRISDNEKLSFLRQQIAQKPQLLCRFLAASESCEAALLVDDAKKSSAISSYSPVGQCRRAGRRRACHCRAGRLLFWSRSTSSLN